jgi:hypothetical protein
MIRRGASAAATPVESRWIRTLVLLIASILTNLAYLATPSEAWARQLPEEDQIRLVAFEYLVGTLFPADTAAPAPHCFSVRDETDFEAPPDGPEHDPGALLIRRIRRFLPDAIVISDCPDPDPDPDGSAGGGSTTLPVIYSVGVLTQVGSTIRVPVSYRVSGQNGGGWACSVGLASGAWRVLDCLPTWISAPD